jgi:hypothetical protein
LIQIDICSDKTGTLTQNEMTVVTVRDILTCSCPLLTNLQGWFIGKKYTQITESLAKELPPDYLQILVDGMAINSTAFEVTNAKGKIDYVVCIYGRSRGPTHTLLGIQNRRSTHQALQGARCRIRSYPKTIFPIL